MGIILERMRQGHRTMAYPDGPAPDLPARWLGWPVLDSSTPVDSLDVGFCPSGALSGEGGKLHLDVGRCIFCGACAGRGVTFSREFAMGRFSRDDLRLGGAPARVSADGARLAEIRSLFGRSLKLREVSAGGCNACEADCNVLGTLAWDMGRFGLGFVASPRHADGILVTGPVTDNMKLALEKTYRAVPAPKVVIAVGACAVSGGVYGDASAVAVAGGLDSVVPVDLHIPGCPPHPLVILEGLLRFLGRIPDLQAAHGGE